MSILGNKRGPWDIKIDYNVWVAINFNTNVTHITTCYLLNLNISLLILKFFKKSKSDKSCDESVLLDRSSKTNTEIIIIFRSKVSSWSFRMSQRNIYNGKGLIVSA